MARWTRPVSATNLQSLHSYLQQPLTDQEKIPLSQDLFNTLCVPLTLSTRDETITPEGLSTLFRVSKHDTAPSLYMLFGTPIDMPPPSNGTEDLFHHTWDSNISNIIRFILAGSECIRNSNRYTSTALQRPDYGLIFKKYCIFRGEEKGSDSGGDPEQELTAKLHWTYHPMTYILGLLWILLRFEKFLCIYDRISRTNYARPLCCNYSPSFEN